jgi:gliding motility-associated protein GldM
VSAEILNAFKVVDNSLKESNNLLSVSTTGIYSNLTEMLKDPKSVQKAEIWKPKADQVKILADEASQLIDKLKEDLKKEADLQEDGSFKEDNIDAATRLFDTKGQGKVLYDELSEFKTKLLAIDTDMAAGIGNKIPLNLEVPKSASGNSSTGDKIKDWNTSYFHMTPTVAALTMLSKFQNDVKNSENMAASFCISQVGAVKLVMDKFEPLVGTNSTYLMPGEEMLVNAGLGAFNSNVKPTVTIDGRGIPVNANGVAEYKFNVGGTGSRSMNVHVTFIIAIFELILSGDVW